VDESKIVIIDDSELMQEILRDYLTGTGYEICTASNGVEANRHIFSGKPTALIFLDVMMPFLSGEKKLQLLKTNEFTHDIPVILISSKPENELRKIANTSGADGYLCKPFNAEKIQEVVKRFLQAPPL
jgi:DNA-binding response OmpR family regulator